MSTTSKLILGLVMIVFSTVVMGEIADSDLSKTSFQSQKATTAQKIYNQKVQAAMAAYEKAVAQAVNEYTGQLELVLKEEIQRENLEQALQIKNEIRKYKPNSDDGLVLYLEFQNSQDGKITDNSPLHANVLPRGVTITNDPLRQNVAKFDVNTKTDLIRIPFREEFNIKQVTIAAWVRTNSQMDNHKRILDRVDDKWNGYSLWIGGMWAVTPPIDTIGKPWVMVAGTAFYADERVNDGQWHHIAATYDGSNLKLFIDGKLVKAKAATNPIAQHNQDITIGNINDKLGGDVQGKFGAYDGLLDDLRLYNRALSDKDILNLFQSEKK